MPLSKPTRRAVSAPAPSRQPAARIRRGIPLPGLTPLASAMTLLLMAGAAAPAQAERPLGSAWFAAKREAGASAATRPMTPGGVPPALRQQREAAAALQRSMNNLGRSAALIVAQQAAQQAARAAAGSPYVPDGLAAGGLEVARGAQARWQGATAPIAASADGRVRVDIKQTEARAILNWESFNVGRNTTIAFDQKPTDAVLNRVVGAAARPSQIQGAIQGAGTVMVLNQNGVVFSGSSQVNVRNLVVAAATMSDEQFNAGGLYSSGNTPTLKDALAAVQVERGARISTHAPTSVTQGGGYVLLAGKEVVNAGQIDTPRGQALMAAGDSFVIRKGQATDGNVSSTTRGNEVAASGAGRVVNSGLVQAAQGDITLTGSDVRQAGVLLASTSVDARGTLHLKATGADGRVTLAEDSLSAVLVDESATRALDGQRNALLAPATGSGDILSAADRRDLSRVEISSGGSVEFQKGSITLATGGQVDVTATGRSLLRDGAVIDVAGAIGVKVDMASNNIKISVQGNEQRDAPVNRDGKHLNSQDVWVDVRDLVLVPAGTNGYATDRWYTAGGLLEVSGYLGTNGHAVGEWLAQGGVVRFGGGSVVTQAGSQINLSGGTLDVADGYINQSWLRGADGRLYEVSRAPGDLLYTGLYKGFESVHARWGRTDYYYNPLIAPRQRFENGYTVGRDAGTLVVSTRDAVLEGDIAGDVFRGDRQAQAPKPALDGYLQSQTAVARGAQLVVGRYTPYFVKSSGALQYALAADADTIRNVVLGDTPARIATGLDLAAALPPERQGTLYLDTSQVNGFGLGALKVAATDSIVAQGDLRVRDGGEITLYSSRVEVDGGLSARAGQIQLGNVLSTIGGAGVVDAQVAPNRRGSVVLAAGARLDVSGRWADLMRNAGDAAALPYLNGGAVALRASGDVTLAAGSLVDASSGAAVLAKGARRGGAGGNVTLQANAGSAGGTGNLTLDGELRGYGVRGGGTLSLQAGEVRIGGAVEQAAGLLRLDGDFFDKGFSAYELIGTRGLSVADGARVDVVMPVLRYREDAGRPGAASGLEVWLPELYQENPAKAVLTQRGGASLSLQAGNFNASAADMATVQARIGAGAVVNVDPGSAISVRGIGQITIDGRLNAWGGKIFLGDAAVSELVAEVVLAAGHARSIWLGEQAVLDAAGRATVAVDRLGRRYGKAADGGAIVIGGELDAATGIAKGTSLFVVMRDGAVADASGSRALLDVPGQGAVDVAGNGGAISIVSYSGLYLDGALRATGGAGQAAGGTLTLGLEGQHYKQSLVQPAVMATRDLVVGQRRAGSALPGQAAPGAPLVYGAGYLAADAVAAGGFDNLSLLSSGMISFAGDVDLTLRNALSLYGNGIGLASGAPDDAKVRLGGAYVRLAGVPVQPRDLYVRPVVTPTPSLLANRASLVVEADLLDVRNIVAFGNPGAGRRGFDQTALRSRGDVRFLQADPATPFTRLLSLGDLVLAGRQVYPGTNADVIVRARRLDIERVGAELPAMPYSAFGRLSLEGDVVNQGGIVRAPLGNLTLGHNGNGTLEAASTQVNLLPGSVTSISGAGLAMPYGGTVDGVAYSYDGKPLSTTLLRGQRGDMPGELTLRGQSVAVAAGAVLDTSGGANLYGAGFVSGRGGSTDARLFPLVQIGVDGRFSLPGLATNPVYAIVPGPQPAYAPQGGESGAGIPLAGRRVTIGAGVPGLPAGTYTLLPSTYALLPGAFRVEFNGLARPDTAASAQVMRNGSWSVAGLTSIGNTGVRDSLAQSLIVTPASVLRQLSQYNETSFADFLRADAARLGVPEALRPKDARTLNLLLSPNATTRASFRFDGQLRAEAAEGGYGGTVTLRNADGGLLEIVPTGTPGASGPRIVTLTDRDLSTLGAARLVAGGTIEREYGQGGNFLKFRDSLAGGQVTLRSGANLRAGEVFLVSSGLSGGITVEQGAQISTLGMGKPAMDSANGFIYAPEMVSVLAVSNGWIDMLPPLPPNPNLPGKGAGSIRIGVCDGVCSGVTRLYAEGTIVAATDNRFQLDDSVRLGARHLTLAVGAMNGGSAATLADLAARNALPAGLALNQDVIDRLLRGDTQSGAPALESLRLSARDAFNFYGDVSLDTYDAVTGQSRLRDLVLVTPAIYGLGDASNTATIRSANVIWNGGGGAPAAVGTGGAGTGSGKLDIRAERIEFGYGPGTQTAGESMERLVLGFGSVNLYASERVTANHRGGLSVYQQQGAYEAGKGFQYSGGNLNIVTPLLTGQSGSVNRLTAGAALTLSRPAGSAAPASAGADTLGADLTLAGQSVVLDSAIGLPSGKLAVRAQQDLTLADGAMLDLSGRRVDFNDVSKFSWGGEVSLDSEHGSIRQAAGSRIDLSAVNNQAGRLSATALDAAAGQVALLGHILGGSSGVYDAGGTYVPYEAGSIDIRAQGLGGVLDASFAALNQRLNAGQVVGARSFQLKRGDLAVGSDVKAGRVTISLDGGHLTVNGTIDASGERVGAIRLSASQGLLLGGNALLDAHGRLLRVDSHGQIIDSPNRAIVELNGGYDNGALVLASGARIDLRHGTDAAADRLDGRDRGTLTLMARRLGGAVAGDVAIDASGAIDIRGARTVAVVGMQRYDDATVGAEPAASGRSYQIIDQAYLDAKHADSDSFIDRALRNAGLMQGKLAGLNNGAYRDAFSLRPGVEIVSNAALNPDGDLVVKGDLDLSGYRYAGVNPRLARSAITGSGEPGMLVLRASGNLDIFGSINDGFAPPPATLDDAGWLLTEGKQVFGGDVVVPRGGIDLHDGTAFPAGATLNYDLPIKAMTIAAGTRLPAQASLAQSLLLPVGTVLSAAVLNEDGSVAHAAGTVLSQPLTLAAGTRLDAGFLLSGNTDIAAMTWPRNVPLPHLAVNLVSGNRPDMVYLDGILTLKLGARIPATTDVKLGGAGQVDLRERDANGSQGRQWAVASMLPEGAESWSLRLVAGADLGAADSRYTRRDGAQGALRLADTHYGMRPGWLWSEEGANDWGDPALAGQPIDVNVTGWPTMCSDMPSYCSPSPNAADAERGGSTFSVLRTGTGDLELLSAGDLSMHSVYGVYTAGTSSAEADIDAGGLNRPRGRQADGNVLGEVGGGKEALVDGGANSLYRAWYPVNGGNLLLKVGGNLTGDVIGQHQLSGEQQSPSAAIGNWLWRQGGGNANGQADPTAWWINFGTYVLRQGTATTAGFTGFGTLGGGNVEAQVAGDAGNLSPWNIADQSTAPRGQGVILAVGSTGRIGADGILRQTGGGDLTLNLGGRMNPGLATPDVNGSQRLLDGPIHDLQGLLLNLRGAARVQAGALGDIALAYGRDVATQDPREIRAYDPYSPTRARATGGIVAVVGDATLDLSTRGDLVLGGSADAGRVPTGGNSTPFRDANGTVHPGGGQSWFSLWTDRSAIDLFAAGGNLTPSTQSAELTMSGGDSPLEGRNAAPTDGRYVYPATLRAIAANGSIYAGPSAAFRTNSSSAYSLLLAPSANGQLQLLAGQSLYAGGYAISQSGAAERATATPWRPGFAGMDTVDGLVLYSNAGTDGIRVVDGRFPLFAFAPDSAAGQRDADAPPARFYARDGDIVGLRTGEILTLTARDSAIWYVGAAPVRMMAGRDIVYSGTALDGQTPAPAALGPGSFSAGTSAGNLFVHNHSGDVSYVSAGRDILRSSFNVAGPGQLEIVAGRNILMEDRASVTSIGPVAAGDLRPGAAIAMTAGAGAAGPDYAGFIARYLDPANQARADLPLSAQAGKVAKTYEAELLLWLVREHGYNGDPQDALAFFQALPAAQQRIFARQVYFSELREGGREYNAAGGPRFGSYLRGRNAIAALFPAEDGGGAERRYLGDITIYGGAGVRSYFGGGIQMLTPGGRQVFGVEGSAPPSTAGIVTQGRGDIQLYALGSILLGQSRVMTTFGGDILGWSAQGDINAGRGAKSTVVYTPPRRVYDDWGNVALSSSVPSTGAGLATLAPIAEVPRGDMDLIAPLGTIDAGEAGIRVSGNVNLAALQVVNAANIQAQGESKGVPVMASVNVGAMSSASAAAASATGAAQDAAQRSQAQSRQNQPSIISVQILGYGDAGLEGGAPPAPPAPQPSASRGDGMAQVVGRGQLSAGELAALSPDERQHLGL